MLIELKGYSTDLSGLLFTARALAHSGDKRIHVTHVLISRGFAYGTNGSRLHRYSLERKYPAGLYRVFKAAKKHIILYKTSQKIADYPETTKLFKFTGDPVLKDLSFDMQFISSYTKIIRIMNQRFTMDPKHLKDLGYDSFDMYEGDKSIYLFSAGRKTAIIMPRTA